MTQFSPDYTYSTAVRCVVASRRGLGKRGGAVFFLNAHYTQAAHGKGVAGKKVGSLALTRATVAPQHKHFSFPAHALGFPVRVADSFR